MSALAPRYRAAQLQKEALAELISRDMSITDAARVLGVTRQRASNVWRKIRTEMGDQAR